MPHAAAPVHAADTASDRSAGGRAAPATGATRSLGLADSEPATDRPAADLADSGAAAALAGNGVAIGAPDDDLEREADRVADTLTAPATGFDFARLRVSRATTPGRLQGQWPDAPTAPGRATSRASVSTSPPSPVTPPAAGWNRAETAVGTIRRIPVDGLTAGNQATDRHDAAVELADGRAIVLVPSGLDTAQPVDVLVHFHGFNVGYRQRQSQGRDPTLRPGSVRDIDTDRIEQQIQASGRRMVAVLPQGTTRSRFTDINTDSYVGEVFGRLTAMGGVWRPAPAIRRVLLSGHSGGGGPISAMMAERGQPRLPGSLGEVALFDAINGPDQLRRVLAWVTQHLTSDLAAVNAATTPADKLAYLDRAIRFRAYYTNSSYAARHQELHQAIEAWFRAHARELGGARSALYTAFRNNYRVLPVNHGQHETIMGRGDRLQDALGVLQRSALGAAAATPGGAHAAAGGARPGVGGARPGVAGPATAPPIVHDVLRSPGRPLDAATRDHFEPRLRHDLGRVRVHTGARADESARAVGALAYTVGHHVVLGSGTPAGGPAHRRLLAHELTHVVQQGAAAPVRLRRQSISHGAPAPTASAVTPTPIRADERGATLSTFEVGPYTVFVPRAVTLGSRGPGVAHIRVHIFFAAGGVHGDTSNDVLVHGLRGASDGSQWITIAVHGVVHSHFTMRDADIAMCLRAVGITGPVEALRITGHSRGVDSVNASLSRRAISTFSIIERVTLLDRDDGIAASLVARGIPASRITVFRVNDTTPPVAGIRDVHLSSAASAAIGYVRLIQDAMARDPAISAAVTANPAISRQLASLPLPPRGSFTSRPPTRPGQVDLHAFARTHRPEIAAILAHDSGRNGLLTFINAHDLARYARYPWSRGIAAHHFFVAEIAHELTE